MNHELSCKRRSRYLFGVVLIALAVGTPQVFAATEAITGDWELTMDFNGRQTFVTLSIAKKPDGTLSGKWGSSDLTNVKFDGQKLTFIRTLMRRDQEMIMDFLGTLKDGKITGTLSSDRGETQVTGVRKRPKPPILGQWDLQYQVGDWDVTAKLTVSQKPDGTVEAQWISDVAQIEVSNVKLQDGKLTLSRKVTFNDNSFESTFEGTAKDHTLTGTIESDMGEIAVTGRRIGLALIGQWELTRTSDRGPRTRLLTIDTDLTGRYESFGGEIPIKDLKIEGDQVSFKTEMGFGDRTFVTEFKAKLDGKTLKGETISDRGTNELTGKKLEPALPATPAAAK